MKRKLSVIPRSDNTTVTTRKSAPDGSNKYTTFNSSMQIEANFTPAGYNSVYLSEK